VLVEGVDLAVGEYECLWWPRRAENAVLQRGVMPVSCVQLVPDRLVFHPLHVAGVSCKINVRIGDAAEGNYTVELVFCQLRTKGVKKMAVA
jgi:hypothetical protein